LQRFWNDTVSNQTLTPVAIKADTVLVLPRELWLGLRSPEDNIWGLWQADDRSSQVWIWMQNALATYDSRLDIICGNQMFSAEEKCRKIIYWN